jgi:peroxiredoxin Q/BCP
MVIQQGELAPDFELQDDAGKPLKLSSLKGKTVVLFFYPKADTPGCTKEACGFRDAVSEFKKRGVEVLGISPDEPSAQAKFKSKFELSYPLLADVAHKVAEDYGVWQEKTMYGKPYMGIARTTFVIGPDGKVKKVYEKVKPEGHAEEVLAAL